MIFEKFIVKIWEKKNNYEIEMMQKQSAELCIYCLNTYKPNIQQRGISLINKIYSISNQQIEKDLSFYREKMKFHLFEEVGEDLLEVLNEIDNQYFERNDFDLNDFFYNILIFIIRMKKLNENISEYDYEIRILKSLASSIGGYIHVQRLNHHIIKDYYWIKFFEIRETFTTAELDETKMDLYSKDLLDIYFAYFHGLIMNCEENMLLIAFLIRCLDQHIVFENIYQIVFFYLSILIYTI